MTHEPSHWSDRLIVGLPPGPSTVSIDVDPTTDHPWLTILVTRLPGLAAALRSRPAADVDPLDDADTADLLDLLDQIHRVRRALHAQEDRVLLAARRSGASWRRLASALDLRSHSTVEDRVRAIERAGRYGLSGAAADEDPLVAGEPITEDGPTSRRPTRPVPPPSGPDGDVDRFGILDQDEAEEGR